MSRWRPEPVRRSAAEVDPEALVATMQAQLEGGTWRREKERDGVVVYSSRELDCPFVGYRTVTEHEGVTAAEAADYLGLHLLDAMAEMNGQYVEGQELWPADDRGVRVVRTAFAMPAPLSDREFVHALFTREVSPGCFFVGYLSVDDPELGAVAPGYVRCPIYPSGQRITTLADGRVRVEHLMVYDLAGAIAPWVQNHLFHRGHIGAYLAEWRTLGDRLRARQTRHAA